MRRRGLAIVLQGHDDSPIFEQRIKKIPLNTLYGLFTVPASLPLYWYVALIHLGTTVYLLVKRDDVLVVTLRCHSLNRLGASMDARIELCGRFHHWRLHVDRTGLKANTNVSLPT